MASHALPVIITRAEPGASETAARVEALNLQPILAPVLELEPDPTFPLPDLSAISGIVFTSANGVRVFADRSHDRSLTAWCVGPATALAARETGFEEIRESAGNAIDLAGFIAQNSTPSGLPLLHVANAAAKGDLKAELEALGFQVTFAPLYKMRPASELSTRAIAAIRGSAPCIALIHSAKGAERFARLCEGLSLSNLTVIAISQPASQPLGALDLSSILIADEPNEDKLMVTLKTAIATLSA